MKPWNTEGDLEQTGDPACEPFRSGFADYLDGTLDGRSMVALAAHLELCEACAREFSTLRSVQSVLAELRPLAPPSALQAQLRDTLAGERRRGAHLSPLDQLRIFGERTLAPLMVRAGAGFAAALLLMGTITWFVGTAAPVQANDDRMADLHPPRFLYSEVPPEPIATPRQFVAVVVEARVDAEGRVYDYSIVEGPHDSSTRARVECNLLASVFKPATVFGEPVAGHIMITYTAVSVRG